MNRKYFGILLLLATLPTLGVPYSEVFLDTYFDNLVGSTNGISFWAGGNHGVPGGVGSAAAPSGTYSIGSIETTVFLVDSAIGQITAGALGYPGAGVNLRAAGLSDVLNGSPYKYLIVNGEPVGLKKSVWDIRFPGSINAIDGTTNTASSTNLNYNEALILQGDQAFRAALRVNPSDAAAASGMIKVLQDRMVPLISAGNTARARSTCSRLTSGNADDGELPMLLNATNFFRKATRVFIESSGNPIDAPILDGTDPFIGPAVASDAAAVVNLFSEALSDFGSALSDALRLKNQIAFLDPAQGQSPSAELLGQIDQGIDEVQSGLLLATYYKSLPDYNVRLLAGARNALSDLRHLRQNILVGQVTFASGATGSSSVTSPNLRYAEYTTDYVPIFPADPNVPNGFNSNFEQTLRLCQSFLADCKSLDDRALSRWQSILSGAYANSLEQESIRNANLGELVELCGSICQGSDGQPVPDILFSGFSPAVRADVIASFLSTNMIPGCKFLGAKGTQTGTIFQQWLTIGIAELALKGAAQDLTNTFSQMQERQLVGTAIAQGQTNLAYLYLSNGDKVALLDQQAGEISAETAVALAQVQAELAQETANNSLFGDAISAIGGIWNPAAYFSSLGSAVTTLANAYDQSSASLQLGQIQADEYRKLAAIQAQKDRISAMERADAEFELANETTLQLDEALHSLALQAERQRLNILLASQQLDQERAKLATLLARVSFVYRSYVRALELRDVDPALSPQTRLTADISAVRAESAFELAQQWAFLTALALQYEDNRPSAQRATAFISAVLAARNCETLGIVVNQMISAEATLRLGYQNSPAKKSVTISLRNQVFQHNHVVYAAPNDIPGCVGIYEPFGAVSTNAEPCANFKLSDAAWTVFLQNNLIVKKINGAPALVLHLDFTTSLDLLQDPQSHASLNPLFDTQEIGLVLFHDTTPAANQGVRINFRFDNSKLSGTWSGQPSPSIAVDLSQLGVANIRSTSWSCPGESGSAGLRVFHMPSFIGRVDASIGDVTKFPGTSAFELRSPANSHWALEVVGLNGDNNSMLLNNLAALKDIELEFHLSGFEGQGCN